MIHPINPATGAVGTPVDLGFSQYTHVKAMQGSNFWTTCRCGNDDDARLRDMTGTELDIVDTDADLGEQLNFGSLAFDETGGVLWMAANSQWSGIAAVASQTFLVGRTDSGEGVIAGFTP